jgi:hypothetical protein
MEKTDAQILQASGREVPETDARSMNAGGNLRPGTDTQGLFLNFFSGTLPTLALIKRLLYFMKPVMTRRAPAIEVCS